VTESRRRHHRSAARPAPTERNHVGYHHRSPADLLTNAADEIEQLRTVITEWCDATRAIGATTATEHAVTFTALRKAVGR
jgi:hypothetical protein